MAHIGFGVMSVIWFILAFLAYTAAINKNFIAHRRWAMRSFAVTFAFVHVGLTFKLFLPYEQFTPQGVQAFQSMVSWLMNLLCVEIYLLISDQNGNITFKKPFFTSVYDKKDKVFLLRNIP